MGLGEGGDLFGDGSVLIIDLPGHAPGHVGLCFRKADPPLLYATDVQWMRAAAVDPGRATLAMRLVATEPAAVRASTAKVARFAAAGIRVVPGAIARREMDRSILRPSFLSLQNTAAMYGQ